MDFYNPATGSEAIPSKLANALKLAIAKTLAFVANISIEISFLSNIEAWQHYANSRKISKLEINRYRLITFIS